MSMNRIARIAGIAALVGAPLVADFSYQETSTITGGAMMSMMKVVGVFSKQAREPIVANVSVKGDRMVHKSSTHASIIDLSSQTITTVDFQKKQYSVMTFDEMKQMLDQMAEKMKEKQKDKPEMKFKVSGSATGKTKQAGGFDAKEFIMKMEMEGTDAQSGQKGGMSITTDMWVAQGVPGYQEVRKFYQRMAEKLNWTPGGNMFMQNPEVSKGMAEVYKEMAKMEGVPVEQFITMGAAGQPGAQPASGDAPPPQQQQAQQQEKPTIGGALGGALGGRFGLGKKKKTEDAPAAQSGGSAPPPSGNPGSLLEMTTVMSGFNSNPVDDSAFAPPAGFKKVESDMKKIR
jgi:hypothetical protein